MGNKNNLNGMARNATHFGSIEQKNFTNEWVFFDKNISIIYCSVTTNHTSITFWHVSTKEFTVLYIYICPGKRMLNIITEQCLSEIAMNFYTNFTKLSLWERRI